MRVILVSSIAVWLAASTFLDGRRSGVGNEPALPVPVTNNAVAAARVDGRDFVFSFLGLGSGKDYAAITRAAFTLDVGSGRWMRLPDVPGMHGRLAATAQVVGDRVYLFGGYEVARDGKEITSAAVDVYDVRGGRYSSGAPIPVPVDDSVSGVWRERLIYLVSGWSNTGNVASVQIYDPAQDRWQGATPIPGPPVFGHAGAVMSDTIVYCDGAVPAKRPGAKYTSTDRCFRGDINPRDVTEIRWSSMPAHPGAARYRMAAGAFALRGNAGVLFAGGTTNPYNYNGMGYDGRPSVPERSTLFYDLATGRWQEGPLLPEASMDHRGLVRSAGGWYIVGGMIAGQRVTDRVVRLK